MKTLLPLFFTILSISPLYADTKSAAAVASSRSMAMDVFSGYSPNLGTVRNYVTTYDGQPGFPLYQSLPNGNAAFSQEMRPRAGSPGVYEGDFVTYDSSGSAQDYGSFTVNLPTTDSDGNGLPDVVQKSKYGGTSVSGSAHSDYYGTNYSITGSLSRAANATGGSYSISLATSGLAPMAYNGTFNLLNGTGAINYSRDSNSATFTLTEVFQGGTSRTLTGSTDFSVTNVNQVNFPQFNVMSDDGFSYTVLPFSVTRSGNRYVGSFQLADGSPETYWADYVDWVLEISDGNDSNGNGIPDLSDAVPAPPPGPSQPLNISTRGRVQGGDNAMIGGFFITGNASKRVIIRALGPSLQEKGIVDFLPDPVVGLHGADGSLITSNDDWKAVQQPEVEESGLAPTEDAESAIIATLAPGPYTAVVSGKSGASGIGLIEVYDLGQLTDSKLANISTRGPVQSGQDVMIGGFILGGQTGNTSVVVRALGPSLTARGVAGALPDPRLELRDSNGVLLGSNDNWKSSQQTDIEAKGLAPSDDLEAAVVASLSPGAYTAVVSGSGGSGVALVELYNVQ